MIDNCQKIRVKWTKLCRTEIKTWAELKFEHRPSVKLMNSLFDQNGYDGLNSVSYLYFNNYSQ